MYPAQFDYVRAESLKQALTLLGEHEDAKLLAGGHSLLPVMKLRLAQPATLIDIGRLDELKGIEAQGATLTIGSLTTHHEVASSAVVMEHCPILAEAAAKIGDPQVRNRGTVGGNLAHADPASDLPAVLVALGGSVNLAGAGGERTISAADFFTGLLETQLGEHEVLTSISVPTLGSGDGSAYLKVEHAASGYAVCGAAAVIRGGKVTLAFNGVSETPLSADAVGQALNETDLTDGSIDAAISAHLNVDSPLSDIQADGAYRTHLAHVYGKRAVQAARDRRG